ncbi:hypothetical protein GCM10027277_19970 [Pseudoduganella ginsengisoli]|uniref:PEP-CTERM sorting domain-containing protein n=1 Tax=Pseudoduganella ginsengisoli TaxID=1462440 RepID=A0A6L6PTJ0_9BURK|nr:PEP-CTERM sorting domain-containing protein [Pseudoduganella ginsengisoli]MTW00747.1 PEP-CTERM sorting domain-containing protein [Pseudoduganella ginsengisoli]
MKLSKLVPAALLLAFANFANATAFVNGGFEDGNANGWTVGGGFRGGVLNSGMSTADFLPGGSLYDAGSSRSGINAAGTVDVNVGAALGSTVYSGNYSYRAEDQTWGGYASVISQKVMNYTDANIFFAWKAVLENGGHTEDESAAIFVSLHDDTTGTQLISRVYNAGAGGGGVDSRFSSIGSIFYTPDWQIEQLAIDAGLAGHDFTLSLLAADCNPTGHFGYAYIDGFGAVIPPVHVPEPQTAALMLLGAGAMLAARRRRNNNS